MAAYQFITIWRFQQTIQRVWTALDTPEDYPRWWPNILYYECLTPENPRGVRARGKRAVRGFLPYSLHYTTTITRTEAPHDMAYDSEGDLIGDGRFVLKETSQAPSGRDADGNTAPNNAVPITEVTIYWNVSTKGRWLNRLAPLLKWLFAFNHNYVMRRGELGLAEWLKQNP
jgi:hypothetical protein